MYDQSNRCLVEFPETTDAEDNLTELTGKRKEILEFIQCEQREKGFPPSVREIAEAVGLASPSSVQFHMRSLEKDGFLRRDPAKPRALTFSRGDSASGASMASVVTVPLIGDVAAGIGTLAVQDPQDEIAIPSQILPTAGDLFMLKVRGDSMVDAGIFEGDYVVVRSDVAAVNGDTVVAGINGGEEGTVKIFRRKDGRTFLEARNVSDARFADPISMELEGDKVFGVVVGLIRRY